MKHGGPRPGAGRRPGSKSQKKLDKEVAREEARKLITASLRPMIEAQIAHAMGIGHLYRRDKTGRFTRVEDQAAIDDVLATGGEGKHYWIFAKDPSVQAFTDLMNRALDKPKEQPFDLKVTNEEEQLRLLDEGRLRNAQRKDE
jgi:hypothetical protein